MTSSANITASAYIEESVTIGERVYVGPGAAVYGPAHLAADVRVDANATLAAPVAASGLANSDQPCEVGEGVIVGAGAIICQGVQIGAGAVIAPGTVVQRNVPPLAQVSGNPAVITGYRNTPVLAPQSATGADIPSDDRTYDIGVGGVTMYRLPHVRDLRGDLSVGEFDDVLPFAPRRYFLVFDVPSESTRGEHAHKACHQFLICTSGRCALIADDGRRRVEVALDKPTVGLHIPPGVWGIQYKYSRDSVLLVFASHPYDPDDYIRDYDEFLRSRA